LTGWMKTRGDFREFIPGSFHHEKSGVDFGQPAKRNTAWLLGRAPTVDLEINRALNLVSLRR